MYRTGKTSAGIRKTLQPELKQTWSRPGSSASCCFLFDAIHGSKFCQFYLRGVPSPSSLREINTATNVNSIIAKWRYSRVNAGRNDLSQMIEKWKKQMKAKIRNCKKRGKSKYEMQKKWLHSQGEHEKRSKGWNFKIKTKKHLHFFTLFETRRDPYLREWKLSGNPRKWSVKKNPVCGSRAATMKLSPMVVSGEGALYCAFRVMLGIKREDVGWVTPEIGEGFRVECGPWVGLGFKNRGWGSVYKSGSE